MTASITNEILAAPLEDRLTLTQLARQQGVSPPTTWRWAMRGCRGTKLQTAMLGHKRITTHAAFQLWVEQVTAAADGKSTPAQSKKARESAIKSAEKQTDKYGI